MFIRQDMIDTARRNIAGDPWARDEARRVVDAARPWLDMSDDDLWSLMFGPTITRSWMVWSNGHCPACRTGVPMYNWRIEPLQRPWKVQCPHCDELFPKNDFKQFYDSGLHDNGVFDPARADRALLFNAEHPDPADPLHKFGVDDGEGYVANDEAGASQRWRFIGTYLIYGQWKKLVVAGINNLAAAYALTGRRDYARKAAILLDRVADLYPSFDHIKQAWVYETVRTEGFVSTWHDACEETREMVLSYSIIRDAIDSDDEVRRFLHGKAQRHNPAAANTKQNAADIRRNIEDGILRAALAEPRKTHSNYPRREICQAVIHTTLANGSAEGEHAAAAGKIIDEMLEKATAVDGVTGEKGLAGYSAYVIDGLGVFLAQLDRAQPGTLAQLIQRHPSLASTYRFHIDTWCMERYYPAIGDTLYFAGPCERYVGITFTNTPGLNPSMFDFLFRLFQVTGDPAYVQVLYRANGHSSDQLPRDLFHPDPAAFRRQVDDVIARHGRDLRTGSINKPNWRLAILRSGEGEHRRAAWLNYDTGGGHGHCDGMNLGLFARGLDLMPDFGYPPVHYGGWGSPRARWYYQTAAHNTVVVDGVSHGKLWTMPDAAGRTTLWMEGRGLAAVRASSPGIVNGTALKSDLSPSEHQPRVTQYERTVATVDVSPQDFYLLDIFRVAGGVEHAKFFHSHYGEVTTTGLNTKPAEDFGRGTLMRNFMLDADAAPGWCAEWKIEDRYKLRGEQGGDLRLRYHDLTSGAEAGTCEGWINAASFNDAVEGWIPRLMVRRKAGEPGLASCFISIVEPYEGRAVIRSVRRLPLRANNGTQRGDADVAVEVTLADGRRDLIIALDVERSHIPAGGVNVDDPAWQVHFEGDLAFIRTDADGRVAMASLTQAHALQVKALAIGLRGDANSAQFVFDDGRATLVAGNRAAVASVTREGGDIWR